MDIKGKTMVFKGNYGYSTVISKKNQEGNYDKMYLDIQLPKDVELENKTMIDITKGFLSFYKTKEGLPKIKIVVMEFNQEQKEEQNIEFDGDVLPF